MLKNVGLFCKRDLQKRPIFCKETYILKHPTHRSHPIPQEPCNQTNKRHKLPTDLYGQPKEPNNLPNEPYNLPKEPYSLLKELYTIYPHQCYFPAIFYQNSSVVNQKNPKIYQKNPIIYQKNPIIYQKSSILFTLTSVVFPNARRLIPCSRFRLLLFKFDSIRLD